MKKINAHYFGILSLGITPVSGLSSAGITSLVSNTTKPLVGGMVGGTLMLITTLAMVILGRKSSTNEEIKLLAVEIGASIFLYLVVAEIGFVISVPLVLSFGLLNFFLVTISGSLVRIGGSATLGEIPRHVLQ